MSNDFQHLMTFAPRLEKTALTVREIDRAGKKVDPAPTEAQRDAGNYAKGHLSWKGLKMAIETAKGQRRKPEWAPLPVAYGYFKGTEGKDGDEVDVFFGEDDPDSEIVFIVNQNKQGGGFDEHKVVIGVTTLARAKEVYLSCYEKGWTGMGSVTPMTLDHFKWWLDYADKAKAVPNNGAFATPSVLKKIKAASDDHREECPFCKTAADLPYRERAEMYALKDGKIYGSKHDNGTFGVYGGGIDPGEDAATAAEREFMEEAGWKVKNVRPLPFDPLVKEWTPPYATPVQAERAKKFRGSRTHYYMGDLDEQIPNATLDIKGRTDARLYDLDEAQRIAHYPDDGFAEINKRRAAILQHLAQLVAKPPQGTPIHFSKDAAWTYVPTQALDAIRKDGLLSGESLLQRPDLMSLVAQSRHVPENRFSESFTADTLEKLKGWKPDAKKGPNVVWRKPPADTPLLPEHPANRFDVTPVRIRLNRLLRDVPGTRVHGQELKKYDDKRKNDKDYADERHRDLTPAEIVRYRKESARRLWRNYADPERIGMYAPDVPHAAVITPDGRIDPKYLVIPGNPKSAFEKSPLLFVLKHAADETEESPFTIAVDLDGTLAEQEKPFNRDSIGEPIEDNIEWVRRFSDAGARIIIFTVRDNDDLVADFLEENDCPYDYINENPDQPPDSSGKVFAHVYWDDRALDANDPASGPEILSRIMEERGEKPERGEPCLLLKRTTVIVMAAPDVLGAMENNDDDSSGQSRGE